MRTAVLAVSIAVAVSMAMAADSRVTPLAGMVLGEGNGHLDDAWLTGAQWEFDNRVRKGINAELSLLYTPKAEYVNSDRRTRIYRVALNAVHDYPARGTVIPFAKAGFGYEYFDDSRYDNDSAPFLDAGVGVRWSIAEGVALKAETVYMLKGMTTDTDGALAVLAGVTFGFGATVRDASPVIDDTDAAEPPATYIAPEAAAHIEAEPETIPEPPLDSDGDGVSDKYDRCDATPAGTAVDSQGCSQR